MTIFLALEPPKFIASGKLTFDGRVVLHRVVRSRPSLYQNAKLPESNIVPTTEAAADLPFEARKENIIKPLSSYKTHVTIYFQAVGRAVQGYP